MLVIQLKFVLPTFFAVLVDVNDDSDSKGYSIQIDRNNLNPISQLSLSFTRSLKLFRVRFHTVHLCFLNNRNNSLFVKFGLCSVAGLETTRERRVT